MTSITQNAQIADDQLVLAQYRRAEAMEHELYKPSMVLNAQIYPHWIGGSQCFWYMRKTRKKTKSVEDITTEYRLVNARTATQTQAFNPQRLAQALAQSSGKIVDPDSLPLTQIKLELSPARVCFAAFGKHWQFDIVEEVCKEVSVEAITHPIPPGGLISPDGKKVVFPRDYNLWVLDLQSGEESALTQNGERHNAYGIVPEARDLIAGLADPYGPLALEALWSPDSSKLFTFQLDERQVRSVPSMLYVPQDGTVAPQVVERKYALSGDKHVAKYRMVVIDVSTGKETAANYPAIDDSFVWLCPFSGNRAWWSKDARHAYFIDMTRGQKTARVLVFDTHTGTVNMLFEESARTYLDLGIEFESPSMLTTLSDTDELIWYSERTGWAHLYLYDLTTGNLKHAITSGDWRVRHIVNVNPATRELLLQISGRVEGRNPYYRELVKVHLDSGEMMVLASGDYDYSICKQSGCDSGLSPCNEFLVVNQSRVDMPSVTELRDQNGHCVLTLETADIDGLPSKWRWPERVTLKADDGQTDIYGLVFHPSDFDPNKSYPVLDFDTVTPFYTGYPTGAFHTGGDPSGNCWYTTAAAMSELGFIVTLIMGRGTPCRSKTFHDFGYESFMEGGGIIDHVAGIKQLGELYPYMDLSRIGMMKPDSPSNGSIFALLNHPDFYKVGVTFSAWDPRLVKQGEIYHGFLDESDCQRLIWRDAAKNLRGKLLLITGMLDHFFHSSMTFQLVDVLVKANKDFDLIIQPNGGHGFRVKNAHRRAWDYLLLNLQGRQLPKDVELQMSIEKMFPWDKSA